MKKFLTTVATIGFISLGGASAFAAWTVFDPSAVQKLTAQINELKKQISELQAIKNGVKDQIQAVGKVGQQIVPILNIAKLENQIRKTVQCSLLTREDLEAMIPSLKFDEYDVGSVCTAHKIYKKALFPSSEEYKIAKTSLDRADLSGRVRARRTVMVVDTSTKALAFADVTLKGEQDYLNAIIELENAGDVAQDSNSRLAVIAKGQALIAKGIATNNQLLSMLLKQQTAHSIRELPLRAVNIED